jgi:superfamily II DNA or RNA helicase/HKD family nuclease
VTQELADALKAIDSDNLIDEALTSADAVERLGRHLLRVARRLRTPGDSEAVQTSTLLVNDAIDALGPDFAGDRVEVPARLLKGVAPSVGLAHALPAHPMIPLTSSELLVNGVGEPAFGKVLKQELRCADEVDLICAFVGYTGFQPLKEEFRQLIQRGGRIRVITSTYLGSTSAKAVDELVKLGAEVRVNYQGHATKLHAKAWLFRRAGELDTAFVGSSNLSAAALYSGLEWNVRLARADAPGVFTRIQQTFDSYWHATVYEAYSLTDRDRLDAALLAAKGYAARSFGKKSENIISELKAQLAEAYQQLQLHARPHQQKVLDTLQLRRDSFNEHRHLVVAATGTGKTVMAALDYKGLVEDGKPRPRLLFVAHREQILEQARATFRTALRDPNFGELLGGSSGPIANDAHVFAMVQTLHNRLADAAPDAYDVIYIDEAHHGAAGTWREVIEHFEPREIVGLTATPERADGVSIAALFGGEYTTELRLWEAVDDQLLAPFEYVGVDDDTDLRLLGWHQGDYAIGELSDLYTSHHGRVRKIVEAIHTWVEEPAHMRALGFCVTKAHAQFMAEQFAAHGFQADYLLGEHDVSHRESVLAKLKAGSLQVVFSVEVLGEGVDVPDVDTLLLLRPTQSPVLFAQQLGRGLRTAEGKASCLVLDFIGQHRAEYRFEERFRALVNPGHGSVQEQAANEFPFLPAGCEINLERVARERVMAALKSAAAKPGVTGLKKDLIALGSGTIEAFLSSTGRSLESVYAADGRKMSWTRLRRLAGAPGAPPEHEREGLREAEALLLKRIGHLQHVADSLRVDYWFDWMTANQPPQTGAFTPIEERLATHLMHLLAMKPASVQAGFEELWRHEAVRAEIAELLTITHERLDASPVPLLGLPDVPLMAHARYTRARSSRPSASAASTHPRNTARACTTPRSSRPN